MHAANKSTTVQTVDVFPWYCFWFYLRVVCIYRNKVQRHIPDTVITVSKWVWQLEQKECTTPWEIFLEFLGNSQTLITVEWVLTLLGTWGINITSIQSPCCGTYIHFVNAQRRDMDTKDKGMSAQSYLSREVVLSTLPSTGRVAWPSCR